MFFDLFLGLYHRFNYQLSNATLLSMFSGKNPNSSKKNRKTIYLADTLIQLFQELIIIIYYFYKKSQKKQIKMEIELQEYENGKPLVLNVSEDIANKMRALKAARKYRQIADLVDTLPCNKEKYLMKANALLHLKDWNQLIKCCDRGLEISEESQFYNLKGKAKGKIGFQEEKILLLQKAIAINQLIPAYHRNLGAAFYSLKSYGKAINEHTIAIKLEPNNAINYHNKGAALFRSGEFEAAKQYFQCAIERDRKLALSFSWMGDCQKELKNYDQAIELYQKAYQISGNVVYQREKEKIEKDFKVEKKQKKKFFGIFG